MDRRSLIRSLAALPLAGVAAAAAAGSDPARPTIRPRRLRQGMTVGLVSPASNAPEDEDIAFAMDVVRSLGFKVKPAQHLYQRTQYLAGTDQQRAADLNAMFADREVDAIFCLRGGYGSSRLLPLLDYGLIAANPKVLMGYSDITALHCAIFGRTGLVTFHGPIAGANFTEYSYTQFRETLIEGRGRQPLAAPPPFEDPGPGRVERENRLTVLHPGTAEGPLLGGNLTLVSHLMGTPWEPDFSGRLLFLEDVHEAPYRVDRMLTQLRLAGALERVAGIAFGKFTEADTSNNSFSMEQVLRERTAGLGVPVLRGLMIGHVEDQAVIPVGARARLDTATATLTLLEPAVA
ncbi:LD-carboxypeptidase [Seongchinamella sediminis]|uniref:LD-carboxypeptidase n=1 Tax=Seongchinamella sediminis TaxID=2283635 RepID=A0A3L7E4A3_9GAMM|nr:LD-carboxypeptidase [Seongchinamella sediminis]RLQ23301.1 LD-carboxypeptidase [Seongchinamella sediminis]